MDISNTLFRVLFPSIRPSDVAVRVTKLINEPTDFEKQMMQRYFASQNVYFILGHLNFKIDRRYRIIWLYNQAKVVEA